MDHNDCQNSKVENDYDNAFSEETEEEIIYNDCFDEDEVEFLKEERNFKTPQKDINKAGKNQDILEKYIIDALDSIKGEKMKKK